MLLTALCQEDDLATFLVKQWNKSAKKQSKPDAAILRALRDIWSNTWRPVIIPTLDIPTCPPTIAALIIKCTSYDAIDRPSIQSVVADLTGQCAVEIETGSFPRSAPVEVQNDEDAWRSGRGGSSASVSQVGKGIVSDAAARKAALLRQSSAFRASATNPLVGGRLSSSSSGPKTVISAAETHAI